MQLDHKSILKIAEVVTKSIVEVLDERGLLSKSANDKPKRSAYSKTELLLYKYNSFKRTVEEKERQIVELREYGVPGTCGALSADRVQTSHVNVGIVLPDDTVESAVHTVQESIRSIVHVISMVDNAMAAIKDDPYYDILEMQYFKEYTQEDIASHFKCSQPTISRNRQRLVGELSIHLFPDQAVQEYLE